MKLGLVYGAASAAILLAASAPGLSHAQTATDAEAGNTLQEVVVTAERFASTVQTTPVAVTAFNRDTLASRQINSVLEATAQIPGIVITPTTATSTAARIVLRGAGQDQSGVLFDPAVGVYIDNVYQPRINGALFDFFDLDHLEVLRGPQGTLYGRNNSGGAIKLETKRPTKDFSGAGDILGGSYGTFAARGYVSGPLIKDKLSGLFSAYYSRHDGYLKDPNYPRDVNNKRSQGYRAKLLWTPTEKFEAELGLFYVKDRSDPGVGVPVQVASTAIDPFATPNRSLTSSEITGPFQAKIDNRGFTLNAHYDLTSAIRLTSITGGGLLYGTQTVGFWLVAPPPALSSGSATYYHDRFFSQEFNATYTTERLKGVAGAYFFTERGSQINGPPYSTGAALYNYTRKTDAQAGFIQATYDIWKGVGLTAGVRYTHEKGELYQSYYNTGFAPQDAKKDFFSLTPKFGVDYQVNSGLLLYASYTKGFKSGGFSNISPAVNTGGLGILAGPTPYNPEKVESYEAGAKFTGFDRRVRLNVAVFEADYKDLQLPVFFPGTSNSYTSNASGARVRGIELEPTLRLFRSLEIYGAAAIQTGKYTAPFRCLLANLTIADCSNRKIKGLIPTKASVGFVYSPLLTSVPGQFHLRAELDHTDKYYNNVANEIYLVATPTNDIVNASLAWDAPGGQITVALEAKNVADHRYALAGLQLGSATRPTVTVFPNEPRIVDVRIRAKF